VKIYLDELEKIFDILYSTFQENNIKIESNQYIYQNFEELSKSPEKIIHYLRIQSTNKNKFSISFEDNIYIEFDSHIKEIFGMAKKIEYLLNQKKYKKRSFLVYFIRYYNWISPLLFFVIPLPFLFLYPNLNQYYPFYISLLIVTVWFILSRKRDILVFSTLILFKRDCLKPGQEKNLVSSKFPYLELFKIITPYIVLFISVFCTIIIHIFIK
jgi:hypothetical protein